MFVRLVCGYPTALRLGETNVTENRSDLLQRNGEHPSTRPGNCAWSNGGGCRGTTPSRLKQFIDATGPLRSQGKLIDKAMTVFTGASTPHGGHETTIASLFNVFVSWGSIIVPLGYTSPDVFTTGNPYGSSWTSGSKQRPDSVTLEVAGQQGARLARVTKLLNGTEG